MAKRSNFPRNPRDYYKTPAAAVVPLLPFLTPGTSFAEPCAGDGALVRHLTAHGLRAYWQSDIEPQAGGIAKYNALKLTHPLSWPDYIITNPPWERSVLHPLIEHFRALNTTWLLLDADWKHTVQAAPYMRYCHRIVSVGRVKWIEGSKYTGKDNCCWYHFEDTPGDAVFVPRISTQKRGISSCVNTVDMRTT